MPESEMVGVALRCLPVDTEHSIIRSLCRAPDYDTLKDDLAEEIKLIEEHRKGPMAPAGVVEDERKEEDEAEYDNDDGDDDEEGLDPAIFAAMIEAAGDDVEKQSQVLALVGGRFKKPFRRGARNFKLTNGNSQCQPRTPPKGTVRAKHQEAQLYQLRQARTPHSRLP